MYSFQVWISVLAISNTEKQPKTSLISSAYFEHDGLYFVSRPSPRRAKYPSWLRSQNHVHLSRQFVRKQARWPNFFPQVFAKNSLIKNIFEEEKKFDSTTWFFGESSFVFGVFGSRQGLQANQGTVRKSAISPKPGNRKRIKWNNTAYLNKRSFVFKIKFCVFQVTTTSFCKKGIRILNAQPVKIPQFKSLLTRKRAPWPHLFIAFFKCSYHECWLCQVSKKVW